MKILETSEDFIREITNMVEMKPKFINMSTYGLYLGISVDNNGVVTDWNFRYPKAMRKIIDRIIELKIPCRIIVGDNSDKPECVTDCEHCKKNNENLIKRLIAHVEKFNSDIFQIVVKDNYHKKLISSNICYIIGGRNLTESGYEDLSFIGEDPEILKKLNESFDRTFEELTSE